MSNPACIFCGEMEDSIQHLLWSCPVSQTFWTELISLLSGICQTFTGLSVSELSIIFGMKSNNSDPVFDLIILLAKFHIYKCKLQNSLPNILHLKHIIRNRYYIDKYNSKINGSETKFERVWLPYVTLIHD